MCKLPETLLWLSLRHSRNGRNLSLRPWICWNRMDCARHVSEAQLQRWNILRSCLWVRRKWNKCLTRALQLCFQTFNYGHKMCKVTKNASTWSEARTHTSERHFENCSPTSSEASWSDCSIWSGSSPRCLLCPTGRRHRDRLWTCWEGLPLSSSPEIPCSLSSFGNWGN